MIEELKLILDSIGDLSGVAVWVVGAFVGYKLLIYLSTTGAIVFLIKLGIVKIHDVLTRPKPEPPPRKVQFRELVLMNDDVEATLTEILRRVAGREKRGSVLHDYLHQSDVRWLQQVVAAKLEEELSK